MRILPLLLLPGLASAAGPLHALSSPPEDPERLERALDAIQVARVESDLRFLADDAMGGRDTPSPGLRIAALYIATRLQRLGFQSAGSGDFYYRWALRRTGFDAHASGLTVRAATDEHRLVFGTDYYLARMSHSIPLQIEGGLVSVGTGTREEFEREDLEGSWALLFDRGLSSTKRAQRYAEKAGAVGILFCETDQVSPYAGEFARTAETITKEQVSYSPEAGRRKKREEVPYVMLTRSAVAGLTGLAGLGGGEGALPAGTRLPLRVREDRVTLDGEIEVANVAGFWPGRDPTLAREVLIVSAHYDHVGMRGEKVFNGADDNASGTAGLLAIAEALAAYGPMRRSVLLLWVSGEEKGLWGSAAWARNPQLPEGFEPAADLNIDMIGRTRPDELYLTPTDTHESFNGVAQAAYDLSELEGFPQLRSQDADWNRSDHFNFDKYLGIPVAFLSAGEHPDYHQPTDTAEKIDFDKLARITRLVVRMLDRIEEGPLR